MFKIEEATVSQEYYQGFCLWVTNWVKGQVIAELPVDLPVKMRRYTEDLKTEEGIPFIEIRQEREDGLPSEKRLKTKQSKRRVPLHPEILKMGFLAFVEQRKRDASHPRLFPDLRRARTGYFSDSFGKWFARFVKTTVGEKCKATFHSFRHQFRDALTEAGVPIADVEKLGGWELMSHSSEREYGHGPSLKRLRQQIQKVKYPSLDLSHLYPQT